MKILHINKRDSGGGAFTACERLHRALLAQGVDSWILCEVPSGNVPHTVGMRTGNGRGRVADRLWSRLRFEIKRLQRPPLFVEPDCHTTFSLNFTRNGLLNAVRKLKPDIVHLHWVGGGLLRIEDLAALAAEFPLVWTLHDMWPFCGAEHVAYTETRWKAGYTKENRPPAAQGPDWNRRVWRRKRQAWAGSTIHTIGVSRWMHDCVKRSRLFQDITGLRRMIHNGLDAEVFCPVALPAVEGRDRRPWRIAFGAIRQENWLKGGGLLLAALDRLQRTGCVMELLTFGGGALPGLAGLPVDNRGRLNDPADLAGLYASADLTVVPSRLESFGQVAAESLACGTPVVCFDTSGLRDVVAHKENGYRARCYDPTDLAEGIRWCLASPERHAALCRRARATALERFRIEAIAARTMELYAEILDSQ
ncbi:MAG: glycosyltransferase [Verrucomicrobia bacterium]|jgi:glycosyltransferase involved in cell wall biosynthesis|nr:glycosyltransferase [Verrucomicrobiota bacterium]